ncbi:MAG: hypothetical protein EA383_13115 [Spirochaetaceae bacterium]|nr:MAG: hypothetical protein EA383_13115 [Spirochaetaceae bacterium]
MKEIRFNATDEASTDLPALYASAGTGAAVHCAAPAMQEMLTHLASLPGSGPRFLRLQWSLDLVRPVIDDVSRIRNLGNDEERRRGLLAMTRAASTESAGAIRYVWDALDTVLDALVARGFRPVLSLMGNPGGRFRDFSESEEVLAWSELIRQFAAHLVGRYGEQEVQEWLFESWNEPELSHWGLIRRPGIDAFLAYYDACSHGLAQVSSRLRFGGPSTAMTKTPLFKALLEHCARGTSIMTGKSGVRIDFISYHEKAMGERSIDTDLNPDAMIDREMQIQEWIRTHVPSLKNVPLFNNESDPQAGPTTTHTWRAHSEYPAHYIGMELARRMREKSDTAMMRGLQNARVGRWGERTMATGWFYGYDSDFAERWSSVTPGDEPEHGHDLVIKPAMTGLALCRRLGSRKLGLGAIEDSPAIRWIAARDAESGMISLLVCHWTNVRTREKSGARVNVVIEGLPKARYRSVRYRLAPSTASAYDIWNMAGAPVKPDAELLEQMQAGALSLRAGRPRDEDLKKGALELTVRTEPGSVELLLIGTEESCPPPAVPGKLRFESYRGDGGVQRTLLAWTPVTSASLLTYRVWADERTGSKPQNIADGDTTAALIRIPKAFQKTGMQFTVTAEDIWGRQSEPSDPIVL